MLAYTLLAGGHLTPDPGIDRSHRRVDAGELRWSDAVPQRWPGQGWPPGPQVAVPMPSDEHAISQAESELWAAMWRHGLEVCSQQRIGAVSQNVPTEISTSAWVSSAEF